MINRYYVRPIFIGWIVRLRGPPANTVAPFFPIETLRLGQSHLWVNLAVSWVSIHVICVPDSLAVFRSISCPMTLNRWREGIFSLLTYSCDFDIMIFRANVINKCSDVKRAFEIDFVQRCEYVYTVVISEPFVCTKFNQMSIGIMSYFDGGEGCLFGEGCQSWWKKNKIVKSCLRSLQ